MAVYYDLRGVIALLVAGIIAFLLSAIISKRYFCRYCEKELGFVEWFIYGCHKNCFNFWDFKWLWEWFVRGGKE